MPQPQRPNPYTLPVGIPVKEMKLHEPGETQLLAPILSVPSPSGSGDSESFAVGPRPPLTSIPTAGLRARGIVRADMTSPTKLGAEQNQAQKCQTKGDGTWGNHENR